MFDIMLLQLPIFFTWDHLVFWLKAMGATLSMTLLGCGFGFLFGAILIYLRKTPGLLALPLRLTMILYTEYFRRVPFLVLLFLVTYGIKSAGFDYPLYVMAVITIIVLSTAFQSEIMRAGIDSVHQNQWDGAAVMNFSRWQTWRFVVIPQSWKVVLPPAFAFFVMFIKDTALASQVGVLELALAAKIFNNRGTSALLAFGLCLVLYFILSYPLTNLGWWMESKLARRRRGDKAEEVDGVGKAYVGA